MNHIASGVAPHIPGNLDQDAECCSGRALAVTGGLPIRREKACRHQPHGVRSSGCNGSSSRPSRAAGGATGKRFCDTIFFSIDERRALLAGIP